MRAWLLRRTGGPGVLELEELPRPEPGPGQVAVAVEAIGLNWAEVLSRKGLYGWAPDRPYVPGMECAGRIAALGEGVEGRAVGEPVICAMQHGAYAERVVVPSAQALPAVPGFGVEENAAFAVAFATAWVSLVEMARLRPTDRVGITAAAGGVGTAAVQIAVAHGCRVLGMAGSHAKLERVRALGAHATACYREDGFEAALDDAVRSLGAGPEVREVAAGGVRRHGATGSGDDPSGDGATGSPARGLDVVLEVVGGDVFRACRARLAPFGRVVVAGYAGLDYSLTNPLSLWRAWRGMPRLELTRAARDSVGLLATHLGYLLGDPDRLRHVWAELTDFAGTHGLRPVVGAIHPFEDLPEAHAFMESRASVGKIVVRVG